MSNLACPAPHVTNYTLFCSAALLVYTTFVLFVCYCGAINYDFIPCSLGHFHPAQDMVSKDVATAKAQLLEAMRAELAVRAIVCQSV